MSVSGTRKVGTTTQRTKFIAEEKGGEVNKIDTSNNVLIKDENASFGGGGQQFCHQEDEEEGFVSDGPYVANVLDLQSQENDEKPKSASVKLGIYDENQKNIYAATEEEGEFV